MADEFSGFWEKAEAEHQARVREEKELTDSPVYQAESKFIGRMTFELIQVLKLCVNYSGRAGE